MTMWFVDGGKDNDVVLSTRIRLARNIKNLPFPERMSDNDAVKAIDMVKNSILNSNSVIAQSFEYVDINSSSPADNQALVEKHLISPAMLNSDKHYGLLINKEGNISIMLNEEDHIRIQSIYGGLNLKDAYDLADRIDDLISESIDYAFSSKYGYLTSCPTNTGTGMRASVMLHLPSLTLTGNIENMVSAAGKWGMTVRGLFGEGSKAQGDFYQLSNQMTMGVTEADTINKLADFANIIMQGERETRDKLKESGNAALFDRIYRSYGTLSNAYCLTTSELLQLLSDVRFGVTAGILENIDLNKLNKLLVTAGPAHIIKSSGRNLNSQERDIIRARNVKEELNTESNK